MLKRIEAIFQNSLVRNIAKGITFATGFVFIFLSLAVLAAALVESVWWFVVLPITTAWCGASFGFHDWLDR